MSNSAHEIIASLERTSGAKASDLPHTEHIAAHSHEKNPQTVTFQAHGSEYVFPYAYIRHIFFNKGRIRVRAVDAKIIITGKNLGPVLQQLRRYQLSVLTLTPKGRLDDDAPFIEAITVFFDEDED